MRGRHVPSLPVAAAALALGVRPESVKVGDGFLHLASRALPLLPPEVLPSFYGEQAAARRALVAYPGGVFDEKRKLPTFKEYSFNDLFLSEEQMVAGEKPAVDPGVFKNAIVVVGTTAAGLSDLFTVPFRGRMPGMQVHASVIDSILSSRFLAPAPAWLDVLVLAAAPILAAVAVTALGVWSGLAATLALFAALVAAAVGAFSYGTWLHLVNPCVGMAFAAFSGVAYHYFVEDREKRKVKRLFSRYVSKDVYDQLMADPSRGRGSAAAAAR